LYLLLKEIMVKKKNKANRLFLFLLIAESLFLSIWGINSYYSIYQARKELKKTEEKLTQMELENRELKEQIDNLANSFYLEKLAREKLGLAKKGEVVYKILPEEEK